MNRENEQVQGQDPEQEIKKTPRRQIPRSVKIHRRREKADIRRNDISTSTQQIKERLEVSQRLAEIGKLLSKDNMVLSALNPQEKAQARTKLEFEEFWLQVKIGVIGPERQEAFYIKKLGDLQQKLPDTYKRFITPGDDGLSEAEKIRKAVMPPRPRIADYQLKR